jgi:hypothetical protein
MGRKPDRGAPDFSTCLTALNRHEFQLRRTYFRFNFIKWNKPMRGNSLKRTPSREMQGHDLSQVPGKTRTTHLYETTSFHPTGWIRGGSRPSARLPPNKLNMARTV